MDLVEQLMAARRWHKRRLRTNIARPEDVILCNKTKIALVESEVPQRRYRKDRELTQAIEDIAPEWWGEDTRMSINRNVQCERHKDGNKGHSYVLWLGDFTGGALLFDDGTRLEEKYKWHKIDGQIHHWNEPHEGTKYSIILYRGNGKPPKSALIHTRMQRPAEPQKNES